MAAAKSVPVHRCCPRIAGDAMFNKDAMFNELAAFGFIERFVGLRVSFCLQ